MRLPIVFLLLAAVGVEAGLLSLSAWQYRRYHQRLEEAAQFAARPQQTLRGEFLNAQTAAWENQPNPASPQHIGWRILTPFQTSTALVVVDRGWAPPHYAAPGAPGFAPFTTSATTVAGVEAPFPTRKGWLKGPDTTTHPRLLAYLSPAGITSRTTAPAYLMSTTPTAGIAVALPPPLPNPMRHLSYSLQWLGLAVAFVLLCLSAWLKSRRSRRPAG